VEERQNESTGGGALTDERMDNLCTPRLSTTKSKHKLHWSQHILNTTVCLAHLLCTSLLLNASAWIHTSLRTPSQPSSYTVYTTLLISNLAQVQGHHSRDMLVINLTTHSFPNHYLAAISPCRIPTILHFAH
jgi:hypothetical protein